MKLSRLTIIFILVALVAIIAFDVWTLTTHGFESTISASIYAMSRDNPIYAFALGIVCGHLFWPNKLAMRPAEHT